MNVRTCVLAAWACAAALDATAAEIFRCSHANGRVEYQELPCAPESHAASLRVPSVYPEVNAASREELLRREAALDQRLEASRERLSREEMARIAARAQLAAAQAASAPAIEPVYVVAWPARPPHGMGNARRVRPGLMLR